MTATYKARTAADLVRANSIDSHSTFLLASSNACELTLRKNGTICFTVDGILLVQVEHSELIALVDEQNQRATHYTTQSLRDTFTGPAGVRNV